MNGKGARRLGPVGSIGLVLLALVGLIYVVSALPVDTLGELRLRALSPWVIPTAVALHAVYLLLSAEVWRRMLRMVTGRTVAYVDAYLQMAAVAVGKYFPGKVWGFVARVAQLKRDNVPTHLTVVGSVVEQVLVIAGGSIVAVAASLLAFPEFRTYTVTLGVLVVVVLVYVSRNVPVVVRWLRPRAVGDQVSGDVRLSAPGLVLFSLAYALLWLISGIILGLIYFTTFDAIFSADALAAIVLANTVGFIAGFVAVFAPGGIGVREAVTVLVLAPFLPVREVVVAAIALRALIVLFDGVNAVILLLGESRHAVSGSDGAGE